MSKPVRVRFAPSPTGPLHLGGVRTALYNYLFARKNQGTFILRIEDTDQTRFVLGAEEYIVKSLQWIGMEIDEGVAQGGAYGPYKQSDRKDIYRRYVQQLIDAGHAYYAFDTPEELEQMRDRLKSQGFDNLAYSHFSRMQMKNSLALPPQEVEEKLQGGEHYVVRIKVPQDEQIDFNDIIRGHVSFNSDQIDDKVIYKSDGMPTYHMANVVDDYLMKISHVIRGEEWLSSTPIHVLLYRFLGWENEMPQFAHLPLILKPDGNGKLSKRDGDRLGFPVFPLDWTNPQTGEQSSGFKERGFLPEAFMNMLAFLGWNPGGTQEIFTKEELIEAFSLERVNKAGAKFDFEKAKWFNQHFIKEKPSTELLQLLKPDLTEAGYQAPEGFLEKYIDILKERVTFLKDFIPMGKFIFERPEIHDEKQFQKRWNKEGVQETISEVKKRLEQLSTWEAEAIESEIKEVIEERGAKMGDIMSTFRIMISGEAGGPPLFEIAEMIGKEEVIARMALAQSW